MLHFQGILQIYSLPPDRSILNQGGLYDSVRNLERMLPPILERMPGSGRSVTQLFAGVRAAADPSLNSLQGSATVSRAFYIFGEFTGNTHKIV